MLDILLDSFLDTLKLIPFLFIAYLIMEIIEHKLGEKAEIFVNKAGRFGPIIGSALGIIPQCGFSGAMSNFYAGGLISFGTLISVFLSTSDEMLPIMFSEHAPASLIIKIIVCKFIGALVIGILLDLLIKPKTRKHIHDLCEGHDHKGCDCEHSLLLASLKHTLGIAAFIFVFSVLLSLILDKVGIEKINGIIFNTPVLGEILAGLLGLIPNCASSVVITELYLNGAMSFGSLISGLMTGSGVGLLILFRANRNLIENLKVLGVLYISGIILGLVAGALPFLC